MPVNVGHVKIPNYNFLIERCAAKLGKDIGQKVCVSVRVRREIYATK
jgi:hypothetical protein